MPTFLILKGTSVKETVRGANPTALRTAILSAAADAAKGSAKSSAMFSGKGQTLGSDQPAQSRSSAQFALPDLNLAGALRSPASWSQGRGFLQVILRFIALYLTSLFSLIPVEAAQQSPFSTTASQQQGHRMR